VCVWVVMHAFLLLCIASSLAFLSLSLFPLVIMVVVVVDFAHEQNGKIHSGDALVLHCTYAT
jgi:hypothetical protein